MITKTNYQFKDEDGDDVKFSYTKDTCRCACYHGCYPDTLGVSYDEDEESETKLDFFEGKMLVQDLIKLCVDNNLIQELPKEKT